MAEEIKLVGVFKDDITPKLKKLTKSIDDLHKSFAKFGKKLRPIAKEMGNLAAASERVADALQAQKKSIDSAARSWNNYKREVGKAGSATRKAFPRTTKAPSAPKPRGGGGGGIPGGGGVAAGVFGVTVGNTISNLAMQGISRGFEIGVSLMQKPFEFLANALGERIEDEMSDIQSAGGMFALDKKNSPATRLFQNFEQARQTQERMNRALATSAAALPGATNDYVRAARGLTDTVMMAFGKNQEAFKEFAVELGAQKGASSEEALTKVLQRFTEQTVLLGQGQTGGMPLTMLMEQLVTRENVNVQSMRMRYAAMRQNPLLASMLEEAEAEMNSTAAGTAERFRAVMKALDKALPQEVVNAMRMSASGIMEAIRSGFLDPDTGLFGLGRELMVEVERNGKVYKEGTTVFKMIRDTLGGFLLPLSELVGILPEIFDPLQSLAQAFVKLREVSQDFLKNFEAYTNWFKQNNFKDAGARGALAAINNLLLALGAIGEGDFAANAKVLKEGGGLADIGKKLLKQLFNSKFMKMIGETLGEAIGGILSAVATVLSGVKDAASAGPFAEGFEAGFSKAGGRKAIATIFKSIFELMLQAIGELFKAAPLEMTGLTGAVIFGPAVIGAIGTWMTGTLLPKIGAMIVGKIAAMNIGGWISGALIPKLAAMFGISGATGGFTAALASLKAAVMGVVLPFAILAAKLALIVGLGVLLVVLLRNLDYVFKALYHHILEVGNRIKLFGVMMLHAAAQLTTSLLAFVKGLLDKVGMGGMVAGALDQARKNELALAQQKVKTEAEIAKQQQEQLRLMKESWARTQKEGQQFTNWVTGGAAGSGQPAKGKGARNASTPASPAPAAASTAVTTVVPPAANPVPPLNTANTHLTEQKAKLEALIAQNKTQLDGLKTEITAQKAVLDATKAEVSAAKMDLGTKMQAIVTALTTVRPVQQVEIVKSISIPMTLQMGSGGTGGPAVFGAAAAAHGLVQTSGYRPGDTDSYHGINRARDYAGPPAQMMSFAKFMAASFGGSLMELIYTPMGFSIKNGQVVPPYAQDTHYDHVHVAYGMGAGNPAFFSSQDEAVA
jgi:hypothetical protein